jgi:hypothetical protein
MISVTVCQPGFDLGTDWDDLLSRAQPNVFMSPAALEAAAATMFSKVHMLLAWDQGVRPQRLVGLWALQARRMLPIWPPILDALPFEYAFLSSPVIDPHFAAKVMTAFLNTIAEAPDLPRVVALKSFDGEAASYQPLLRAIEARGGRALTLKTENRPVIWRDSEIKLSSERRKKIRQSWKRLAAVGQAEIVFLSEPSAIAEAFETFLQLEFRSWKGEAGTALLCDAEDAAFVRRLIGDLAARRQAMIEILQVDGRSIAIQILLFSGNMAYTWKTTFDPDFAKYSPGVMLIDKLTEELFATTNIAGIDSCSVEGSYMAQMWSARRTMIDMLVDTGPGPSLGFLIEAGRQLGRERLKGLRDRLRAGFHTARGRKHVLTPQPSGANTAAS